MEKNKIIKTLRKIFNRLGWDIKRYTPKVDRLDVLKKYEIETVLDVGANVGQFAKEIRQILPNVFIYSFEPIKDCFATLKENMSGDNKFKAFNFALGKEDSEMEMNKSEYSPSSSILEMANSHKTLFPHTKNSTYEKIVVKKLDNIKIQINGNVLLKIDTQGYEDKVLSGGTNFIKNVKVIVIETSYIELYKGQPLFSDIYQMLKNLGFEYKGSCQQKLRGAELISEDSLFIRN